MEAHVEHKRLRWRCQDVAQDGRVVCGLDFEDVRVEVCKCLGM